MAFSPFLLVGAVVLSALVGYYSGRATGRRLDNLWQGLQQGKPDAIAIVTLVAAITLYVMLSYEPPQG